MNLLHLGKWGRKFLICNMENLGFPFLVIVRIFFWLIWAILRIMFLILIKRESRPSRKKWVTQFRSVFAEVYSTFLLLPNIIIQYKKSVSTLPLKICTGPHGGARTIMTCENMCTSRQKEILTTDRLLHLFPFFIYFFWRSHDCLRLFISDDL